MTVPRRIALFVCCAVLGWAGASVALLFWRQPPAIVIGDPMEVDGEVTSPGMMDIRLTAVVRRPCRTATMRMLLRRIGTGETETVPLPGDPFLPALDPGEYRLLLHIEVPAGVPPGQWTFRSHTISNCGIAGWRDLHSRPLDVPVRVTTAAAPAR